MEESGLILQSQKSKMRRKQQHSLSRLILLKNSKNTVVREQRKDDELTVTVKTTQRSPLLLRVPAHCNLKILRSMISFHLKKSLPASEYSLIIGFQNLEGDHYLDYLLQNGQGELQHHLFLNCLMRREREAQGSILDYKICRLVSIGGFSKVYLMRNLHNGRFFAGKFLQKEKASAEMVQNQYQLSRNITHPFIMQTHQLIETEHFFVFVLDFYPGGELFQLLKRNRHMAEDKARFYIVEVLLALEYLHEKSIAFRDIKPENIILDHKGHIKLVDFGLAKRINKKSFSFCGSLDYMAPQIIKDGGHSFEVDYYAVGNLLFQILIGSPPFYHPKFTAQQTKYHILNSEVRFPSDLKLSKEVVDLISQLLNKQPTERLGFSGGIQEILSHEWFKGVNASEYLNKTVEPPIPVSIKLPNFMVEEESASKKMWEGLLHKDIRQEELRETMKSPLIGKGNRHRSLNSQQSMQDNKEPKGMEGKNSKTKSNMCLLYTLTHKRAASQCQVTQHYKITGIEGGNSKQVVSVNVSRKNSVLYNSQNKLKTCVEPMGKERGSQANLQSNIRVLVGEGHKQKENMIRKRKKQNQLFFKQKNT